MRTELLEGLLYFWRFLSHALVGSIISVLGGLLIAWLLARKSEKWNLDGQLFQTVRIFFYGTTLLFLFIQPPIWSYAISLVFFSQYFLRISKLQINSGK